MSGETVQMLEAEFARQPKPDRAQIEEIATRLGQKEMNVYAWFYRRRRSLRESGAESPEEEAPRAKKIKTSGKMFSRFFTKEELTVLENVFLRQSHPGESEIAGLAKWFRKEEKKISAWFARRRMKFTKDFVKSLDADAYVSPATGDVKAEAFDFSAVKECRRTAATVKTDWPTDDEEECDVVRVTPPPHEGNAPVQQVRESVIRPNVIRWYSPPKKEVTTSPATPETLHEEYMKGHLPPGEAPMLVPIDYMMRHPGPYSFSPYSGQVPPCCYDPLVVPQGPQHPYSQRHWRMIGSLLHNAAHMQ